MGALEYDGGRWAIIIIRESRTRGGGAGEREGREIRVEVGSGGPTEGRER